MQRINKTKVLYMPSTPLNILVCVAHAFANKQTQKSQIILIDQKEIAHNIYFEMLLSWKDSPFGKVFITPGLAKGFAKLRERKKNFKVLESVLENFATDAIAVGSDRRVEFQYLIHLAQKSNKSVEGWYMDDGLYSYSGRSKVWYKDLVNSLIKKITYGLWWKEPITVGASSWITQAWLFKPTNSVSELQAKLSHTIPADWLVQEEVQNFSGLVCNAYGLNNKELLSLGESDLCVLIPHPNNIKKIPGYQQRLESFLSRLSLSGLKLTVKYHPRTAVEDLLQLNKKYHAILIPKGVAFEFVLTFLSEDTLIVGDVGTALLTAKWLRSDLEVNAVLGDDQFPNQFRGLYKKMGVNILLDFESLRDNVIRNDK